MGCSFCREDFPQQETYKICMVCTKLNRKDVTISCIDLNVTWEYYTVEATDKGAINVGKKVSKTGYAYKGGKLLLKCSNNHLFSYRQSYPYCEKVKKIMDNQKIKEENIRLLDNSIGLSHIPIAEVLNVKQPSAPFAEYESI